MASFAVGVSGNSQVGSGDPASASFSHALLWQGSAASYVDLNPTGFTGSTANGVSDNTEIGDGSVRRNGWQSARAVAGAVPPPATWI